MNNLKYLILIPLLLLAACDDKKILQVSYDIQVGINTAAQATVAAHQSGVLSDAGFKEIALAELDANNAYISLETALKQSGQVTKANKQSFLLLVQNLAAAAGRMQTAGTLHIKNPDKQKAFLTAVAAIQAAAVIGQSIIASR